MKIFRNALQRRELVARQDAAAKVEAEKIHAARLESDPEYAVYDLRKRRANADREIVRLANKMSSRVSQLGIAVKELEELEKKLAYVNEREPFRVETIEGKITEARFRLHELRLAISSDDEKLTAAKEARKALGA